MQFRLYVNIAVLVCTAIGFVYGVCRFFHRGKAMYLQMIVCGVGSMMLGRLFQVVMLLTRGRLPEGFHVGVLGTIGCFMFFLSANFGQIDSLADDGGRENVKYRMMALLAPVVIALGYLPIILSNSSRENKVVCGVVAFFIMQASYFHCKHLLLPDVELGIVRCLRSYNFLALVFALLSMAEMTLWIVGNKTALLIVYVFICLVSLAIVPVLERGVRRWTI